MHFRKTLRTSKIDDENSCSRSCDKHIRGHGLFELSCIFASASIIVTILLLLNLYNGKRQPDWTISLNTAISFLAIFAKFCIVGLLSCGIGQLKWTWFTDHPRSLGDVEAFDSASRGEVWANIKLPWLQRFKTIATLGCLAFLLGVGFEPFTQNLVRYKTEQVLDTSKIARLANSTKYSSAGPIMTKYNETLPRFSVDPALKANVYSSVFSKDPSKPWSVPKYTCSSGNCHWNNTETLGVRALCSDLTHLIYRDCDYNYCGARIVDGPELYFLTSQRYAGTLVINVTTTTSGIYYKNATLPVVQYIMVSNGASQLNANPFDLGPESNQPLVATECSFEVCVQSSKGRVTDGIYTENDTIYWCQPASSQASRNITLVPGNHLNLASRPGGQSFGLSYAAWQSITWFTQNIFDSSLYAQKSGAWYVMSQIESLYAPVDVGQSIFYGNYSRCDGIDDHLTCVAHNVAAAMTKSFRDSAYINYGLDGADMAFGQTFVAATIVHIDWAWVTLPGLIWILSVVLWLTTAWQSKRRDLPLWKNSTLPLLHLLEKRQSNGSSASSRWSNVGIIPKDDVVQLQVSKSNIHIV